MDHCDPEDAEKCAHPEGDKADADVGTHDVHDPVGGEGRDAEDNEEGEHVLLVGAYLVGPFIESSFPFRQSKEGWAEGG